MKHRILFLAANPAGLTARKLAEEAHEIQTEIQLGSRREQFEFVPHLAAQPIDVLRALRSVRPSIVQFVGHTLADGIYLTDEHGQPLQVTRDALREAFGAAGKSVQIVVLNGCATEELGRTLCDFVPVCVGTPATISDDAARAFSIGFYGGLASGESAAQARSQGKAAMLLRGLGHHTPLLHHRHDIDPETFVLVEGVPTIAAPRAPAAAQSLAPPAGPRPTAVPAGTARHAAGTDLIAPLVLLQLSDLQFGPNGRFAAGDPGRLAADWRQALDEVRDSLGWREPVALVLVTGDIAETARPPEYATAATFFASLARELELPPYRFVFVPGNHDISWTKCREVEGQLEDGEFPASELRERLDAAKLAHFEKFLRNLAGGAGPHETNGHAVTLLRRGAAIHDFSDLGLSIAALNSCERESHRRAHHVGALGAEQARAVLDHWTDGPADRIRIAALHHNPSPAAWPGIDEWLAFLRRPEHADGLPPELVERIAADFTGFEGRDELLDLVSEAHASLVFHGHPHPSSAHAAQARRHRDGKGSHEVQFLSAGGHPLASSKLPRHQPVALQLVRIDPPAAQLHPVLLTWDPSGPAAHPAGSAHRGRFLLDGVPGAARPVDLPLPSTLRGRFRTEVARDHPASVSTVPGPTPPAPELATVVELYRKRKRGWFERWDLRTVGPTPTAGNRPAEITLDEMYIPLRFAPLFAPHETDHGAPIHPEDVIRLRKPHVVIGAAGSGKTTWLRWTFRRLIGHPNAVPFFLELRAIAAAWRPPQDAPRSIESYLAEALNGCGASDPGATVAALLAQPAGPRPVILIDGWDELGDQGERMREHLVELCRAYPRAVVVVSSRPYGETRPAGAEAFETLYIQPLSDPDVRLLATRFHRSVHGHDDVAGSCATDEFMTALAAAPDARSLAGTALLLTMMLLLSREGPLPDRRHKLYTACLRNMLLHRVTQREREGVALDGDQQWRPDDSEERLRMVAELAYRMQSDGYKSSRRAPLVRSWRDAVGMLGPGWPPDQRERFLRWLVASAGVLIDRTDGSVQFAHLSFQEYLAAYYLFISREGGERIAAVRSHMGDTDWWETLRLWAGLIGDQWPDKLGPVLEMLRADANAYWLAGQMFADGTGRPSDFEAWVAELPARLSDPFTSGESCAAAWGACKQLERRARIATVLASVRALLHWLEGIWYAHWCDFARLDVEPAPTLLALEAPLDSAAAVARSRVLHGAAVSWPDRGELAMLRLWPSARAAIGVRLQAAISLGIRMPEVTAMLPPLLMRAHRPWSADDRAQTEVLVREFGRYFAHDFGPVFGHDFARDFARDFVRYFGRDLARDFVLDFVRDFVRDFGRNFVRYFERHFARYFVRDLGRDFVRDFVRFFGQYFVRIFSRYFGRYLGRDFGRDFIRGLGLSRYALAIPSLPAFALLEASSVAGRASPRAALAHGSIPEGVPLLAMFRTACRASFAPADARQRDAVAHACDDFDGDALWPALARHVARSSTAEDRELLLELARHPERRPAPLSWGLRHYVRGDLVLDNDSVVTLDELCARAGLAPLPLLDEMPEEIEVEIPFDDA